MASVTKQVNHGVPSGSRLQLWDTGEDLNDEGDPIGEGDIIRISDSLGRPSRELTVTDNGGGSTFKVNSVISVYPRRLDNEMGIISATYDAVADGEETTDTGMPTITLASTDTIIIQGPIETLEFISGDLTILAR